MIGIGIGISPSLNSSSAFPVGPYPAPSGYRWEYVAENGQRIYDNGEAVIDLVEIA